MNSSSRVKRALMLGYIFIMLPMALMILGTPLMIYRIFEDQWFSILLAFITIIPATGIALIYRSFLITKWRLWAFDLSFNDEDLLKLKKLAIRNNLISYDGSYYEKMEIRSLRERRVLAKITERLSIQKAVEDIKNDLTTPEKVIFRVDNQAVKFDLMAVAFTVIIILVALSSKYYPLGIIILLIFIKDWKQHVSIFKMFSSPGTLEIDTQGILVSNESKKTIKWVDIVNIFSIKSHNTLEIVYEEDKLQKRIVIDLLKYDTENTENFYDVLDVFISRNLEKCRSKG